ncbi:carbon starvation CstA family protein [Streptomyces alkaliterrae]|uniref:Carbon starvation protein A n=1 Tax=Streptomyces alkaliterrae TaxID=2213162 RepID=A0A5P0YSG4_9ACTN|nr:carbon starvation protein A [Streptomyces alkaliterrae]MBB1253953.1 carbon starvation protein A [Streptomyces alkaliterrae]MBB1260621.1 carbon starvation protein A [Streptomyces alkaliterrae]MQS02382.1 carbon starvation protein A [Streptomyces alkaliterrae]
MNALPLLLIGLAIFAAGYVLYSKFLGNRVYKLDASFRTPAHELNDGVDYVPTNKFVLWGHHFTSVAGAAPIVGPAVAVIWGWVPAFLWVTLGTVFFAGMHDLGALWASARNKGRSMGTLSARYIGGRGAKLFLVVIFLLLLMVIAAFAVVIKNLLISTPSAVIPAWGAVAVALLVGQAVYRYKMSLAVVTVVGVTALYGLILLGDAVPVVLPDPILGMSPGTFWIVALFGYAGIASLLPVWVLLQPRDYINGVQLFVGLGILFVSVMLSAPTIVAPAINNAVPAGTPDLLPLLFVTIACGAISGFHGMVSSGTTSKQLDKETDARFVGYFGAVGEGLLALGAIIAAVAGFRTVADWEAVYTAFGEGGVGAFVAGGGAIVNSGLGLPVSLSSTVLATMAILFAATTMDTGVRLLRFVVQEAGEVAKLKINNVVGTLVAVGAGMALTFSQGADGSGGLRIWPLFGTSNQLLASLTLSIIAVMLIRKRRNPLPALVPLAVVFVMAFWAALAQLGDLYAAQDWLLLAIDGVIIVAAVWVAFEAFVAMRRAAQEPPEALDADAAEKAGLKG